MVGKEKETRQDRAIPAGSILQVNLVVKEQNAFRVL
jgi:hypothetical protein